MRKKPLPKFSSTRKIKCPVCEIRFVRERAQQKACSEGCAIELAKRKLVEARTAAYTKKPVKRSRERQEYLENDKSHVAKQAKAALHRWIVAVRDKDKPCVSSGRTEAVQWQAGHYIPSVNSSTRYDENNIHKQSSEDNMYRSGNLTPYRIELINRIGLEEVERLESSKKVKRWTIEELRAIRDDYRQRLREAGIKVPTTH